MIWWIFWLMIWWIIICAALSSAFVFVYYGAAGEIRTPKPFRASAPEADVFANFTTAALFQYSSNILLNYFFLPL